LLDAEINCSVFSLQLIYPEQQGLLDTRNKIKDLGKPNILKSVYLFPDSPPQKKGTRWFKI